MGRAGMGLITRQVEGIVMLVMEPNRVQLSHLAEAILIIAIDVFQPDVRSIGPRRAARGFAGSSDHMEGISGGGGADPDVSGRIYKQASDGSRIPDIEILDIRIVKVIADDPFCCALLRKDNIIFAIRAIVAIQN